MKSILFTLLALAPLSTMIAEDSFPIVKPPLGNSIKYSAKLTKIMTHGEYKQFAFESLIRINQAKSIANITIMSYENMGNIYCNFETDIHQQAVAALALWLSQNTNIEVLMVTIKNHDGQTLTNDFTMRECQRYLINNEWKIMYTVQPYTLIG